jgi:hypothetical protein
MNSLDKPVDDCIRRGEYATALLLLRKQRDQFGKELSQVTAQVERLRDDVGCLEEDLDTAQSVARAILYKAQEYSGRQFVSDHVFRVHPWLDDDYLKYRPVSETAYACGKSAILHECCEACCSDCQREK